MLEKWLSYKLKKLHGAACLSVLAVVFIVSQFIGVLPGKVLAEELPNRSLQVINPLPSESSAYNFNFDLASSGTLGSIKFEFCANSPLIDDPCIAPAGFSAAEAILASQSGIMDFNLVSGTPNNEIIIGRTPTSVPAQSLDYVFDNVINTSATGTSYVRIYTYASNNGTGTLIDSGGIAYPITSALDIATEVPQFLEFCTGLSISGYNCSATSGDQINFGDFSDQTATAASSEFMAATNASYGYNIFLNGGSLTSGNNVISPITSPSASKPGTNQYGINLVGNTEPSIGADPQGPGITSPNPSYDQVNKFYYKSGDILAHSVSSDDYRKFTVSYLVNISPEQAPGDYVSTMYFICLANF